MDIYAKFSLDREEGKTESTENVEAELLSALEDSIDSVDVEDSVYTVTSVDIVENPARRSRGAAKSVNLGPALLRLADTYFKARPIALNLGDPESAGAAAKRENRIHDMGPDEVELDHAIFHLIMEAGSEISKAQQAAFKAKARAK
jgi:hypothetical protein